jgi:hypothetical protein
MSKPIFNIIDPGMISLFGHHREINMAIAKGMRARGYHVRLWANKAYKVTPQERYYLDIEITPYFTYSPYAVYDAKSHAELIEGYREAERSFFLELKKLNPMGIVHISNLFSYQFLGLSQLKNEKISACVHHHPDRYSENGEILWAYSWARVKDSLCKLRIVVVEEQMLNEINRCADTNEGVLLAPFPLSELSFSKSNVIPKSIGILGGMRREQGVKYLGSTIEVIKSYEYSVVLQDNNDVLLNKKISAHVKLMSYSENFTDLFNSCGAILLNYDPTAYRFMGSGIMWEAAANGIPVLYTRGTAISTIARKYGFGLSFSYSCIDSLKRVLESYINNQDKIHQNSDIVAQRLRNEHGLSLHLDFLMQ